MYAYTLADHVPTIENGSTLFHHIAEKNILLLTDSSHRSFPIQYGPLKKMEVSHRPPFAKVVDHIAALDCLEAFKPREFATQFGSL